MTRFDRRPPGITRRGLLSAGGGLAAGAAVGVTGMPNAFADTSGSGDAVEVENLGPGNVAMHLMSGLLVGETFYVGSRNLEPTRVVAFHAPTATVTSTIMLGNGNFVQGLAADGEDTLYAGVTHAADTTNLYRVDLKSGQVHEAAAVAGLYIRDLAVASDGIVYITGRPRPHADGPPVYSYDPASGRLSRIGIPDPNADQGRALVATETTVYYGSGSALSGGGDASKARVFALDRSSHDITDITPPELADDDEIRELALFGDLLVVSTINSGPGLPGRIGLLDLGMGEWRFPDYIGSDLRAFVRHGDTLIITGDGRLDAIDLNTLNVTQIDTGDPGIGSTWGMGLLGDVVLGGTGGTVWSFDLQTREGAVHDLVELGAEGGAMLGMSLAADNHRVYVAGTGSVDLHDLRTGQVDKLDVPGEVKDMVVVGTTVYMGVYNSQGIWRYRPGEDPRRVATLPTGQNRPMAVRWDDVNDLVVLAVRADSLGGGSLCVYSPDAGSVDAYINPLGDSQVVRAAAAGDGIAYIGGNRGDVAAVDPLSGRELWRLHLPFRETSQGRVPRVNSLVTFGPRLFGTTERSLFVLDLRRSGDPHLVHHVNLSAFTGSRTAENPTLLVDRAWIYSVSDLSLMRINPFDFTLTLLVDDLGGEWFGPADIAADPRHHLYTLSGRDLIRVTVPPR